MKATLLQTSEFARKFNKLGLIDTDLQVLEWQLMDSPMAGAIMEGTGGLRKVRFAAPSKHTGKSGSTRVCYVWIPGKAIFILYTIFAKNEKDNLTKSEKNEIRAVINLLKDRVR